MPERNVERWDTQTEKQTWLVPKSRLRAARQDHSLNQLSVSFHGVQAPGRDKQFTEQLLTVIST